MNLSDFDPNQIKDDGACQAIISLLNLVDRQQVELERLRAENERQQAELNRLKEQPKRPKPKPAPANAEKKKAAPDYSSEADRKRRRRAATRPSGGQK